MVEELLTSSAKLKCIKVLGISRTPLHLRRIVNLTGLAPRSAQLALQALKNSKVLTSKKIKNREVYNINQNSKFYTDITELITKLQSLDIKNRSKDYQNLNTSIAFIDSASQLIKHIKDKNELD